MAERNRGKQPNDDKLFAEKWHPIFRDAVDDVSYLLGRGYADSAAVEVVGNRYRLNKRQRNAIFRVSCSPQVALQRQKTSLSPSSLCRETIEIDGFNLLIFLESTLSGGYIFKSRDGLYRDISSIHGSYKRVMQTEKSILLVGQVLEELEVKSVKWYLDKPVSNSGRLKSRLLEIGQEHSFNWQAELVFNPDKVLATSSNVIISSDSWILDQASRWFNLGKYILDKYIENPNVLYL